jgi:hypothetical protein
LIPWLDASTAATSKTAKTTETASTASTENIPEHVENVIHVAVETTSSCTCPEGLMTKLIILASLFFISKTSYASAASLNLSSASLSSGIPVRMVLQRHLTVGFFNFILTGTLAYAQYIVIISF